MGEIEKMMEFHKLSHVKSIENKPSQNCVNIYRVRILYFFTHLKVEVYIP